MVAIVRLRGTRRTVFHFFISIKIICLCAMVLGAMEGLCAGFVREGRILSVFYENNKNNSFGCIGNYDSFLQ